VILVRKIIKNKTILKNILLASWSVIVTFCEGSGNKMNIVINRVHSALINSLRKSYSEMKL